MTAITAAVARADRGGFALEQLELADPRAGEVLVRFTAVGLCHTDLVAAAGELPTPLPAVLGHEGAGVVTAVGAGVHGVAPGDRVVASFSFCGQCTNCLSGQPAYCPQHFPLNFAGETPGYGPSLIDAEGHPVQDHFFGQSSFGSFGLCRASSLCRVPDTTLTDEQLAPLGCGIITGAGAVWNSLQVTPGSSVTIFGAGAVGLSAVMAAVVAGAAQIIAIDVHPGRLALAKQLGATDTVLANGNSVDAVMELTRGAGVGFSVESSGLPTVTVEATKVLSPLGSAAVLGIAPAGSTIAVDAFDILLGRTLTGSVVGHQAPAVLIQRVITLHAQGRFPFPSMIRTYPLKDINAAISDVRSGETIKAVLRHDEQTNEGR